MSDAPKRCLNWRAHSGKRQESGLRILLTQQRLLLLRLHEHTVQKWEGYGEDYFSKSALISSQDSFDAFLSKLSLKPEQQF